MGKGFLVGIAAGFITVSILEIVLIRAVLPGQVSKQVKIQGRKAVADLAHSSDPVQAAVAIASGPVLITLIDQYAAPGAAQAVRDSLL